MNEWLQAALLGLVQGLTEFLPVSSSGHLVLAQQILGEDFFAAGDALFFDLLLHVGTLLPVLVFYRRDLVAILAALRPPPGGESPPSLRQRLPNDPKLQLALGVVLATIPTGLMGIFLEDHFERLFHSVRPVAAALAATGCLLLATKWFEGRDKRPGISPRIALVIGVVQGLAITPGVSRSESTIAAALFFGIDREAAARFSFLLSIPAILGAVVLKARHGIPLDSVAWGPALLGFAVAAGSGYGALVFLVALVRKGRLYRFAGYLLPLAVLAWIVLGETTSL